MKTIKSLFAVGMIAAAVAATSVYASAPLVAPHWKDAPQAASGSNSVDSARAQTPLGKGVAAKASGSVVVSGSAAADPNLIACKKVGKAVCPICGTAVPCSTKTTAMACCN